MLVIHPNGRPESSRISALLEDRAGTLWCGTEDGLITGSGLMDNERPLAVTAVNAK